MLNTSNTFCPPHDFDVAVSRDDRFPQSVLFVIGSMGILRRNFNFLPVVSLAGGTPSTSVSRVGG